MNAAILAPTHQRLVAEVRVSFDLAHRYRQTRDTHKCLQLLYGEVAHANRTHEALLHSRLHRAPRLLDARRKRRASVASHRPVHQVQVEVVHLQRIQRLSHRRLDATRRVVRVPQLTREEHVLALQASFRKHSRQRVSNLALVAVHLRAVDVAVSVAQRNLHRLLHLARLAFPRSESNLRDGGTRVPELERGYFQFGDRRRERVERRLVPQVLVRRE